MSQGSRAGQNYKDWSIAMWKSLECAVQGRGHIKDNIPCQDKTFVLQNGDDIAIALADGAGSAKLSHFGAEKVSVDICNTLLDDFEAFYEEQDGVMFKKIILDSINSSIEKLSADLECETKDLASTLLAVAIKNDKYIILHIGDGVIGYSKNDKLKVASAPENGEFVNTTVFTTSSDAISSMKAIKGELNSINGFVLMSDGTEASMYNKRDAVLAPGISKIMDLCLITDIDLLQQQLTTSFESIIKKATIDDCSIVIISKDSNRFDGFNALNDNKKAALIGLLKYTTKQLRKYDNILNYAQVPISITELSRVMHVKPKYLRNAITRLVEKGYLYDKDGKYVTTILMNPPT